MRANDNTLRRGERKRGFDRNRVPPVADYYQLDADIRSDDPAHREAAREAWRYQPAQGLLKLGALVGG
jgi:hypothetical protein